MTRELKDATKRMFFRRCEAQTFLEFSTREAAGRGTMLIPSL